MSNWSTPYGYLIPNKAAYYKTFRIPKRSGGRRQICAPTGALKDAQRALLGLLYKFRPYKTAMAYRKGLNVAVNAAIHAMKECIVRMDIKDFFPSITMNMVRETLIYLGLEPNLCYEIAELCTLDDELPQGAPTSPALSNLVCFKLDVMLSALAARYGEEHSTEVQYTRYADDIVFSADDKHLNKIIPAAVSIIEMCASNLVGKRCGGPEDCRECKSKNPAFKVNTKKILVMRRSNCQMVTGLTVNEGVSIPRRELRRFRATLHNMKRDVVAGNPRLDIRLRSLEGYAAWVYSVNPQKGQQFLDEIGQIRSLLQP